MIIQPKIFSFSSNILNLFDDNEVNLFYNKI